MITVTRYDSSNQLCIRVISSKGRDNDYLWLNEQELKELKAALESIVIAPPPFAAAKKEVDKPSRS